MIKKFVLALCLTAVILTTACHTSTHSATQTPAPPVSIEYRAAQYVQILATANANAATVVVSLQEAGTLSPENAAKIATYQSSIARATAGMAQILAQPGTRYDKAVQIQNLALSLIPPSQYEKFGASTDLQFRALVTALNAMESTIKIIVQMAAQQAAQPAGA